MVQECRQGVSRRDGRPTFVLVHGAHSSSYAWSPVLQRLALLGHRALAVDLPGHGMDARFPLSYQAPQDLESFSAQPSPLAEVTWEENVTHVVAAVRRVAEYGPVVLVGTSGGGAVISGVGNAVPDLISRIVYVSAWCCVQLPSVADYLETLGHRNVGSAMVNWRSADPRFLHTAKEGLMADATDEQFRACLNILEPADSARVLTADARVQAGTWGRIPRAYIRFARDRAIPLAMQDRMIAEADALTPGNPFQVHTVDTGHVGVQLRPDEVAAILDTLG
ncbi:alpha/beta fold hydrolase [Streptomyces celluloflavus]|uniref:alpha/beta fold hydrolase n=1 Tax=Streptomyces celluloflavus TaxID=58344 RepID=UPI0036AD9D09